MIAANRQPGRTRRGFTLVELVVAAVAGSILVGAVAVSLGQMMRARNVSATRRVAFQAADAAAARIAADLQSVVRDPDLTFCKVQVTNGGLPGQERDQILLLTKSDRPVRGLEGVPEGDVFEVQYRVGPSQGQESLWRRIDPALDDFLDAGGVAAPVADGVIAFSVEASDGTSWFESWDSDAEGLPHAVRFTVTVRGPGSDMARSPLAISRRTIAIDRVPLPPESESEDTQGQDGATPGDGAQTPQGGSGGAGGGGGGGGAGGGGGPTVRPGGSGGGGGGAVRPGGGGRGQPGGGGRGGGGQQGGGGGGQRPSAPSGGSRGGG